MTYLQAFPIITRMSETSLLPLLLTERQVAELLNISTRTVQRLTAAGKLRPVPIGTELLRGSERKRPGRKPPVRYRRQQVLKLAETGWTWE